MNLAALSAISSRQRPPNPGTAAEDGTADSNAPVDAPTAGGRPPRPRFLSYLTRRHATLAAGGLVVGWITIVMTGAVADSSAATDRERTLRSESVQMAQQLEAAQREVDLVQSDAYVRLEARAYGMGRPGERAFSLQPNAPAPPPLRMLGDDRAATTPGSPLDDWLEVLFGR